MPPKKIVSEQQVEPPKEKVYLPHEKLYEDVSNAVCKAGNIHYARLNLAREFERLEVVGILDTRRLDDEILKQLLKARDIVNDALASIPE